MAIVINRHGHSLEKFYSTDSEAVEKACGGHAVLLYHDNILLCHNKYRDNWELPGGGKETGENIDDCVRREIYEETGQKAAELKLKGVSRVYIPRFGKSIFWAVFLGRINEILPFAENQEMSKIILWDGKADIGDIDEVDLKIIQLMRMN